jgi:hypothetical protein
MLPSGLSTYVSLALLYQWLGKRRFGQSWRGNEYDSSASVTHDGALQLREDEQRKLTKLRENYPERTVDRAFAAELLAVNDATGFLLEDYPNDERASEILALASAVVD